MKIDNNFSKLAAAKFCHGSAVYKNGSKLQKN